MDVIKKNNDYQHLVNQISKTYLQGQKKAVVAINKYHLDTYWQIGQYIVEFEQGGGTKAQYGKGLLQNLSIDLTFAHGKGFSQSNLIRMRQLYIAYPICAELPHKLSWSHFVELLKIEDPLERSFYEKQSLLENWSTTELIRQKKASLFLRLAASKDKEGIQKLAKHGQIIELPIDLIREPCVLEFLQVPEPYHLSETELEYRIINKLQQFLLELGKGFAFIGRQYRITLGNKHYYVDLVFYHRILKCFVLIDLKKEEAGYEDVGQMNMYLGYFENEENTEGDNPPIGIVLAKEKDELLVKYAMHNISSQLFVSKYQLYLPNREELRALIERQLNLSEKMEPQINTDKRRSIDLSKYMTRVQFDATGIVTAASHGLAWLKEQKPQTVKDISRSIQALSLWGEPASFLIEKLISMRKDGYWETETPINDTARACIALSGREKIHSEAIHWLQNQQKNENWNNNEIDTAYALIALGDCGIKNENGCQWLVRNYGEKWEHPGTTSLIITALSKQDKTRYGDFIADRANWLISNREEGGWKYIATSNLVIQALIISGKEEQEIAPSIAWLLGKQEDNGSWKDIISTTLTLISLKMYLDKFNSGSGK